MIPNSKILSLKEYKFLFYSFKCQMKSKNQRRCPFIRNRSHHVISTQMSKDKTGFREKPPYLATAYWRHKCVGSLRQLLQVINFLPVKGVHSNLNFWICMSSFQLKRNFASCDKALTKTVAWVLSDEEVEFPFSTWRQKSPQQIWQIFLLAVLSSASLSNNHLKQNQFRLASRGMGLTVTWLTTSALYSSGKNTQLRAAGPGYRS